MTRIGRWLLLLAGTCSLGSCVVTSVLWGKSHTQRVEWGLDRIDSDFILVPMLMNCDCTFWGVVAERGTVFFGKVWDTMWSDALPGYHLHRERWVNFDEIGTERRFGTCTRVQNPDHLERGPYTGFLLPCWTITLITGILPVALIGQSIRRRVVRTGYGVGRCIGCGYDLRATPKRCPECGRISSKPIRPDTQT